MKNFLIPHTPARPKNDRLAFEILSVVEEIPVGRVATYGQIARLIGREKNARLVGSVLANAAFYGRYPCHRVVNASGSQRSLHVGCAPSARARVV